MAQKLDVRYVHYYTDGSAARKLAPVQPFKTLRLPRVDQKKQRVIRIDPFATAGIVIAAVMLIVMSIGVCRFVKLQHDVTQMESYVQTLKTENSELTDTYRESYDLEEVRKTVVALGFVPREAVKHVTVQLPEAQDGEKPGVFEKFGTFLTGLFA